MTSRANSTRLGWLNKSWQHERYVRTRKTRSTSLIYSGKSMLRLLLLSVLLLATELANGQTVSPPLKSEATVQGQAFIVTAARENIRLALVEILVYPQAQATKFLSKSKAARDAQVDEIFPKYKQAETEFRTAEAAYEQAQRSVKQQERWKEIGVSQNDDDLAKAQRESLSKSYKAAATAKEAISVSREYESAASPARYFDGLPEPLRTVKTDIDGKFALRVPRGKYILMASSKRRVPAGDIEDYYWILKIDSAKDASPIFLSNDNLVQTNCRECALVHKGDSP
jgi:hypothetical protein